MCARDGPSHASDCDCDCACAKREGGRRNKEQHNKLHHKRVERVCTTDVAWRGVAWRGAGHTPTPPTATRANEGVQANTRQASMTDSLSRDDEHVWGEGERAGDGVPVAYACNGSAVSVCVSVFVRVWLCCVVVVLLCCCAYVLMC